MVGGLGCCSGRGRVNPHECQQDENGMSGRDNGVLTNNPMTLHTWEQECVALAHLPKSV